MYALLRPNSVPAMVRHLSKVNRAAFHACPNLPRQPQNARAPNGLRPMSVPAQGNMSPSETFASLDVLGSAPVPTSAVEATYADGFLLTNGTRVYDGVMLVDNEVFKWRPVRRGGLEESKAKMGGVLELAEEAWGLLDVVYPKPELLILGTGYRTLMLSPETRAIISELGIRLDVMSTHSAAAQYNLLATERSGSQIAAAMLVDGFGK